MIYEASFSGILKIIFWILVISFIVRLVARLALPHVMRKAQEKMNEQARQFQQSKNPPRQQGDVTIESTTSKSKKQRAGDYTDYVEIKD